MFRKNLHADLLKMKGIPILFAHVLIPVLTCGLFFLYYSFSVWNENTKIIAFYQTIGAGFPVLIGIFTASIMEQEQNAGGCQNLLTLQKKTAAFLSKVLLLLIFSLFSIILTTVLFWFAFSKILGGSTVSIGIYMMAAFLMWCSSIPLYISGRRFLPFGLEKECPLGRELFPDLSVH